MRCSVKGCPTNSRTDRASFYRFPTKASLRSEWINFYDNENLDLKKSSRVCDYHFDKSKAYRYDQHGRLKRCKDSVPTIKVHNMYGESSQSEQRSLPLYSSPALFDHTYADFISTDPEPEGYSEEEESWNKDALQKVPAICNKKLIGKTCCERKLRLLNMWRRRAQHWKAEFLKINKQFEMPQKLTRIFNNDQKQVALGQVKKVKKWSEPTILRGLQTRFACGNGYEFLRQQNLPYPSTRTLLEYIQGVPFDTGVLEEMIILLDEKLSMTDDSSRDCGLFLDEMSIDEANEMCPNSKKWYGHVTLPSSEVLATKGLVFMLGGISQRWKQTVAFEFTGNSVPGGCLKSIVLQILEQAEGHNLRVHYVTSDCGSANKAMWVEFGVNVRKDTLANNLSIQHPVDPSRKLEFIADPVHIFKNSVHGFIANRKIFLPDWYVEKRGLSSSIVNREHLKDLVNDELNQAMFHKLAGRLSEADVDFDRKPLSNVDKMKVSNATKFFNPTIAAALEVVAEKTRKLELKSTAAYIGDLVKWYDLINSRDDACALNPAKSNEYTSDLDHLAMMCRLFSDLGVGEKGHWKPWQSAAVMATRAILRLQEYLFSTGYTILYTSRFTQDCLENLFSVVRSKQKRPTALQMKQHLRTITLSQYMRIPKDSSYDVDERQYLITFSDFLKRNYTLRPSKKRKLEVISQLSSSEQNMNSTTVHESSSQFEFMNVSNRVLNSQSQEFNEVSCIQTNPTDLMETIVSTSDRAKLNALFHVSRKIASSVCTKLCEECRAPCLSSAPFNENFARYSMKLQGFQKTTYLFPSQDFFNYFIILDYWYDKLRADTSNSDNSHLYTVPMPSCLMNCHDLKGKLIKTLVKYKIISETKWKTRKSKYDSRSMVV